MKVEIRDDAKRDVPDRIPVSRKVVEDALESAQKRYSAAKEKFYRIRNEPGVKEQWKELSLAECEMGNAKIAIRNYGEMLKGGGNSFYPIRTILGEFISVPEPKVVLYLGSCSGLKEWRYQELIPTFIHEMFHAVNYFISKGVGSVREVEEPMVEFATGVFLSAISKQNTQFKDILRSHMNDVLRKSYSIGNVACYGFGAYLMNNVSKSSTHTEEEWIKAYSQKAWNVDPTDPIPIEIVSSLYPSYPADESSVFKLFEELLFGKRSTSGLPRLSATQDWALTATKLGWGFQTPLMSHNDLIQLLSGVLSVMKHEGFESYLSLSGDKITFLGKSFSRYKTSPSRRSESLCVKGKTVFLDLHSFAFGPAGWGGNFLYALGLLFDGTFTIVHENMTYTLYGPANYTSLFSTRGVSTKTVPASGASRKNQTYEIIDKRTGGVLSIKKGMGKTALFLIGHYCSMNPGVTFSELQKIFGSIPCRPIGVVALRATVDAYKSAHPHDTSRFYENNPIVLSDGDEVVVSTQWADNGPGQNFSDFKKIAESLGYNISSI